MSAPLDEAQVETVEDPLMGEPGDPDPDLSQVRGRRQFANQPYQAEDPSGLGYMAMVLLSVNPWVYLALAAALFVLWRKFGHHVQSRLDEWRHRREMDRQAADIKKNPDIYKARMEAIDAQRRRMQERYDVQAAEAAEKEAAREEDRRKQKLEDLENLVSGKGYRNKVKVDRAEFGEGVDRSGNSNSNNSKSGSSKRQLRPDYNPLMGSGGGACYRPSRRNLSSGGG